jgi:anti-sigma F factor
MDVKNEMRLAFPSKSQNESFSRVAVSAFFSSLDPTLEELNDIKTAVSEAVTNAIVHGYGNKIGVVYIYCKILSGNVAYIRIRDNGKGINDINQAREPMWTSSPESERAGLGFSVMESFMDTLRVFSRVDKGTTIVMTKKISAKQ